MGFFNKLFGASNTSAVDQHFDLAQSKRKLGELSAALDALGKRMRDDAFPIDNPGWQGRIDDLAHARAEADRLESQPTFDRQDLFDYVLTVRPLSPAAVGEHYALLEHDNARVLRALAALTGESEEYSND